MALRSWYENQAHNAFQPDGRQGLGLTRTQSNRAQFFSIRTDRGGGEKNRRACSQATPSRVRCLCTKLLHAWLVWSSWSVVYCSLISIDSICVVLMAFCYIFPQMKSHKLFGHLWLLPQKYGTPPSSLRRVVPNFSQIEWASAHAKRVEISRPREDATRGGEKN